MKYCSIAIKSWLHLIGVSSFLFCLQDFQQFFHKSLPLRAGSGSHNKVSKLCKCGKQSKAKKTGWEKLEM